MPFENKHKRFDCHMHTPLCGHAYGDPVEYVEAAAESGVSLVTFTCHIPMKDDRFAQEGIRMRHSDGEGCQLSSMDTILAAASLCQWEMANYSYPSKLR